MPVVLSFVLGVTGNATAIISLLSPMPTFWRICKKKTTDSFSSLPYLFGFLSGIFWLYYGFIKQGGMLIVTLSAAGCAFQGFYLSLYLCFCSKPQRKCSLLILLAILVSFVTTVVLTMTLAHRNYERVFALGILCSMTSVLSYGEPLGVMKLVIKTRSVQYMPFYLSLFLFINGAIWLAYALAVKDMFVAIPNGIGFLLGANQVALYAFYSFRGESKVVDGDANIKQIDLHEDIEMGAVDGANYKAVENKSVQ